MRKRCGNTNDSDLRTRSAKTIGPISLFLESFEQPGNIRRIILAVAVHDHDGIAPTGSLRYKPVQRRSLADGPGFA